jgi:hypothetical protein
VLVPIDYAFAACVQKNFGTVTARRHGDVGCVYGVRVAALKYRIYLCVNSRTASRLAKRLVNTFARMALITVELASRHSVVAHSQDATFAVGHNCAYSFS